MNTKHFKIATISIPAFLLVLLSGCLKTHEGFVDFTQTTDFVILTGAGTGNFKASNLLVNTSSPDTLKQTITVNLASKDNTNGDVAVTLGVDAAALTAYNAANGTKYQPFPSGSYKLINTKVTVPAGQHYGTTTLEIYQNKLDPTVSYMLPISITDGGGKQLSSNQNTIYYNVIGNPLAGIYKWDFSRFNSADTSGALGAGSFTGQSASPIPANATTLLLPDSYLQTFADPAAGVALSFTDNAGTLSNFSVAFDQFTKDALAATGFSIAVNPKLVGYTLAGNAANHYAGSTFRIYFSLINSTGGTRTMVDNYVKQ
jgi:hypothetical protein